MTLHNRLDLIYGTLVASLKYSRRTDNALITFLATTGFPKVDVFYSFFVFVPRSNSSGALSRSRWITFINTLKTCNNITNDEAENRGGHLKLKRTVKMRQCGEHNAGDRMETNNQQRSESVRVQSLRDIISAARAAFLSSLLILARIARPRMLSIVFVTSHSAPFSHMHRSMFTMPIIRQWGG